MLRLIIQRDHTAGMLKIGVTANSDAEERIAIAALKGELGCLGCAAACSCSRRCGAESVEWHARLGIRPRREEELWGSDAEPAARSRAVPQATEG